MRYRISEIRIGPEEFADRRNLEEHVRRALEKALWKRFGFRGGVSGMEIIRESIDARKKPDVKGVYTVDFDCPKKLPLKEGGREEYKDPEPVTGYAGPSPVIAGFGPCGIFAALLLARAGLKPIVLERGKPVEERVRDVERFWNTGELDPESNVQFGEGGAGTFSDGKLTTGIRDIRTRKVLTELAGAGADPQILFQAKPHIGTDQLRTIVPALRRRIEEMGGEVRFGSRLCGLIVEPGGGTPGGGSIGGGTSGCGTPGDAGNSAAGGRQLTGVRVSDGSIIPTGHLILAIGHSARDTFRMLQESGLPMERKPFSIGVRIEHPQELIDRAQYGDPSLAEQLGPAAYKLNHRCENGRGVYTFCMCPGGQVINASSEEDGAVCNGMSESGRDSGTANSALLVDVRTTDFPGEDPLAGVEFQRRYERLARENGKAFFGGLPKSSYRHFRADESDPVRQSIPAFAGEAILEAMPYLGKKLSGFDGPDAMLTAVETRSSSPVRILRDSRMRSIVRGIIPAGEGPGYAGGIMSAAADGIRAAEQIIEECRREEETRETDK